MAKANKTKTPPKYQQIIDMNDEKINVLILGTSGGGKSTLINKFDKNLNSLNCFFQH